jgi:transcriptional regulator with XRE-family HTH domain
VTPPKNRRVAPSLDERITIGRRLKRLRDEQGLKQKHIVEKTGMSTGTVQAIERGKPNVLLENIDKYAEAVNTTIQSLLHPEIVPPPNALLKDLNKEHLGIARLYMKAYKTVRAAVEILLVDDASRAEIIIEMAEVVLALKEATDRDVEAAAWTAVLLLEQGDLITPLARRLSDDPAFEQTLRDSLENPPRPKK